MSGRCYSRRIKYEQAVPGLFTTGTSSFKKQKGKGRLQAGIEVMISMAVLHGIIGCPYTRRA
jgi:hypothetical protein